MRMGIEGHIELKLSLEQDRVAAVGIRSSRPVLAAQVFQGKPLAEALEMLPLLFSVCGTAQACAGVRAGERAQGLEPLPEVERLRESLVRLETLREHVWRILLDWPGFIDLPADRAAMAQCVLLQRECVKALNPGADAFRLGQEHGLSLPDDWRLLRERWLDLLQQKVFAMPPRAWLEMDSESALAAWAGRGESIAARLIAALLERQWQAVGSCEMQGLPTLQASSLNQAMVHDDFVHQPTWQDRCRETSSLTRAQGALLSNLRKTYGNGLLVRLVARLTELAELVQAIEIGQLSCGDDAVDVDHTGIGQVSAARGQLVHRIELDGERVEAYRILAPTEWNFHPQGVVAGALLGLQGDEDQVARQARLLINAIDPCVGYELSLEAGDA